MALTDLNAVTDARLNQKRPPLAFRVDSREDAGRLKQAWRERLMTPVLLKNRLEGLDVSFRGRDSRLLLTGDESAGRYAIEDVIYASGWEAPAYHMEEAEQHWYVVDGEVEITVGERTETCREGAFAYIPRNTTCAIRNRSAQSARVFQWSSPAGYDRALQEIAAAGRSNPQIGGAELAAIQDKYGVVTHLAPQRLPNDSRVNEKVEAIPFQSQSLEDFMHLREIWAPRPMTPKIIHDRKQGIALEVYPDTDTWCILSGDESAASAMVLFNNLPPGLGVPAHYQPTEEELFYSLDEGLWWRVGGGELVTEKGSFAFAPRFGTHQFSNPLERRAAFITINSPAGHERGLLAIAGSEIEERENESLFENWGWRMHGR